MATLKFDPSVTSAKCLGRHNYKTVMADLLSKEQAAARSQVLVAKDFTWKWNSTESPKFKCKRRRRNRGSMTLDVPGLSYLRPRVVQGTLAQLRLRRNMWRSTVTKTEGNQVLAGVESHREGMNKLRSAVVFKPNLAPYVKMRRAIDNLSGGNIEALFPPFQTSRDTSEVPQDLDLFDKTIEGNTEQFQAIKHIVAGSSKPYPYLLFGPPGTGKTTTLTEAIKQVWLRKETSKILVCAPSNSVADLIASKLLGDIPEDEILRAISASRQDLDVDEDILATVVYVPQRKRLRPAISFSHRLARARIVVTTLITASLMKAEFSHVFVDESASATEPETLVPLTLLQHDSKLQIILSGDPKQLGPVTRSEEATQGGLGVSLMERLMTEHNRYQPDKHKKRDPRFITKLRKNFRSHQDLLSLPSQLFYDNELEACSVQESLCHQLKWLPQDGCPLVFHDVANPHSRAKPGTSLCNPKEVDVLMDYIIKLLRVVEETDIGVLSPYSGQVNYIKEKLEKCSDVIMGKDLTKIEVGSTEQFQGRESRVVLLSTVRSSMGFGRGEISDDLGFLKCPKRFNVAITRAKSLLIVIGDANLLKHNENWKALIDRAKPKRRIVTLCKK